MKERDEVNMSNLARTYGFVGNLFFKCRFRPGLCSRALRNTEVAGWTYFQFCALCKLQWVQALQPARKRGTFVKR